MGEAGFNFPIKAAQIMEPPPLGKNVTPSEVSWRWRYLPDMSVGANLSRGVRRGTRAVVEANSLQPPPRRPTAVDGQRADVIEQRRLQRAHVTDDFLNVIDSKQLTEPTETARTLLLYLATVDVPRQPMIIGKEKLKKKKVMKCSS